MPTSEQIEAAAKALFAGDIAGALFEWGENDALTEDFRTQARAALEAVETLTGSNVSNGPVADIPGGEMSAEALEEVEWEYAVLNRDNRQVTDPDLTEAECRHNAEPYLKRGWVVRRRRRGPGPWIALEGEKP